MTNRLTNLNIEELSGVDKAANLYDGWVVMKSKGGTVLAEDLDELLEKADDVVTQVNAVCKALDEEEGLFVEAPDGVKKAARIVKDYLDELIAPEDPATRKNEDGKPGFMARVMAALVGSSTQKEAETVDDTAWAELCKKVAEGPKKEEASV